MGNHKFTYCYADEVYEVWNHFGNHDYFQSQILVLLISTRKSNNEHRQGAHVKPMSHAQQTCRTAEIPKNLKKCFL